MHTSYPYPTTHTAGEPNQIAKFYKLSFSCCEFKHGNKREALKGGEISSTNESIEKGSCCDQTTSFSKRSWGLV